MLRFRRYRVFLCLAAVVLFLLYRVSQYSDWEKGPSALYKQPSYDKGRPSSPNAPKSAPEKEAVRIKKEDAPAKVERPPANAAGKGKTAPVRDAADDDADGLEVKPATAKDKGVKIPTLRTSDEVAGKFGRPTPTAAKKAKPADEDPVETPKPKKSGAGKTKSKQKPKTKAKTKTATAVHWEPLVEHFPVPEESLILIPTGKPKPIPKVQHKFAKESEIDREKRLGRLAQIKDEAKRAWDGYRKYAWGHDELTPISKSHKDPFCGWAATMVDAMDTLWIMGLKDEFDDAYGALDDIDFTTTPYRSEIPVFETTIRYLGGLVAAYDVTGGPKGDYPNLLTKAEELAEILMGVFDTPNRMPILYYDWHPSFASAPKRASPNSGVAEMGSLAMEFTRLAQLTGKHKYYDAVARITDAFEDLQIRGTALSGIFPEQIDASGCNRSAGVPETTKRDSMWATDDGSKSIFDDDEPEPEQDDSTDEKAASVPQFNGLGHKAPRTRKKKTSFAGHDLPDSWQDCVPQGLSTGGYGMGSYSMGGSQDSTYEYFPKQYILLGGLVEQYQRMHIKVVEAVKKYLLYRPMTKGDRDILFSAKAYSRDHTDKALTRDYEVTHLTCFLGGMFGLGGKIFDRPEDVEIGKKLADGCVWAYESMPAGVMAEGAMVLPCQDPKDCTWDEKKWHRALDYSYDSRAADMEDYQKRLQKWKKQKMEAEKNEDLLRKGKKNGVTASVDKDDQDEKAGLEGDLDLNRAPKGASSRDKSRKSILVDDDNDQIPMTMATLPPEPTKPMSHEEYIAQRLKNEHLVPGFVSINDKRYLLRPEAIESVWYMYRITGDPIWQEKGWKMWKAVVAACTTPVAHSAIENVLDADKPFQEDSMESFWLAETLKYFYLLFAEPDVISLDDWVLNTEAHPFRRPS